MSCRLNSVLGAPITREVVIGKLLTFTVLQSDVQWWMGCVHALSVHEDVLCSALGS